MTRDSGVGASGVGSRDAGVETSTVHAVSGLATPESRLRSSESPGATREARDAIRSAILEAVAARRRLRIVGAGTWLDAGRPVADASPLALGTLAGILEYTPGDLTLTALAGTSLATIDAATRAEGQWLALAPWGGDAGTLGATVATASAGPMSGAFGTPRDIVIGLEAVTGTGDVVRGGGRVVKNVAGFDLTRLMVGAWGTLGAITEVSVRLRALPEVDETIVAPVPSGHDTLVAFLARVRESPIAPVALEVVTPSLASVLELASETTLLVRLAGNAELVRAQRDEIRRFTDIAPVASDVWARLRQSEPARAVVLRLSGPLGRLAATWEAASAIAASVAGGFAHASVHRAVVRVVLPLTTADHVADGRLALARGGHEGVRIFERLPANLWHDLAPSAVASRLASRVLDAFDPHRILNPGILGEEEAAS